MIELTRIESIVETIFNSPEAQQDVNIAKTMLIRAIQNEVQKDIPVLIRILCSSIKKIKEMLNMNEVTNITQDDTTSTVANAAVSTLEEEKGALIAKLKSEIANTKSSYVKFRDTVYIAALEEADNLVIEALLHKLAKT